MVFPTIFPASMPGFATRRQFALVFCLLLCAGTRFAASAQTEQHSDHPSEKPPVLFTTRIFQAKPRPGVKPEMSEQIFKVRTQNLTSDEQWIRNLGKAYPDMEISLVRSEMMRAFYSPVGARLTLGPRKERHVEFLINIAQSPGDGEIPGLSIVPLVEYHFGNDKQFAPVTQAFPPPIEYEQGMSYFFTGNQLNYNPESYVNFLRPAASPGNFKTVPIYLIFAMTRELENPFAPGGKTPTAIVLDPTQAAEWQAAAAKTVQPEWPEEIKRPGFDGRAQVRAIIGVDGKVTDASIWMSEIPEANARILAAARQWEFPAARLAEKQMPVHTILSFTYTGPKPAPVAPATPGAKATGKPASVKGKAPVTRKRK
ncbi:MAG: energy transducer TonB [Blastocatellia bacterium]